jgi:hypothetical protein
MLGEQDVYTNTKIFPLQGSRFIRVYHLLLYICFPMIYTDNNNHGGAKRFCGARRRRALVVFCSNQWKTDIHQKRVYANKSAALQRPILGIGVYILLPHACVKQKPAVGQPLNLQTLPSGGQPDFDAPTSAINDEFDA